MNTSKLRMVVIDDSSTALNGTVLLLQEAGHEVEALHGPEGAVARVRELKPDVVVCDVSYNFV